MSVCKHVEEFTSSGNEAIKFIERHIQEIICNGDRIKSSMLLSWVAHNVQYPGKKLLWSPIIQSIPGVGKTFFDELLTFSIGFLVGCSLFQATKSTLESFDK